MARAARPAERALHLLPHRLAEPAIPAGEGAVQDAGAGLAHQGQVEVQVVQGGQGLGQALAAGGDVAQSCPKQHRVKMLNQVQHDGLRASLLVVNTDVGVTLNSIQGLYPIPVS